MQTEETENVSHQNIKELLLMILFCQIEKGVLFTQKRYKSLTHFGFAHSNN